MRKALTVGLLLAAVTFPAVAQTDAERRRAHLPYVRAATDCIANAIRQNDAALGHAASGRWGDATELVTQICLPQLRQMVSTHDAIYGSGGMEFFRGPYINDLPRALSTRLRPDIERRQAALAERERRERELAEQRRQAEEAQEQARLKLMGDALRAYSDCIEREAVALLPFSNEGAETISNVADTKCAASRDRITTTSEALFGASRASRQLATDLVTEQRKKLLASIVTLRAAAEAARVRGNNAPSQTVPAAPPGRAF